MCKFRQVLSICTWQLRTWRRNPRVIIAFLIGIIAAFINTIKLSQFAADLGEPLHILEPFILNASNIYITTLSFLGLLLLLADAPFTEQSATYSITRAGRSAWTLGKILYIALACLLYTLVPAILTMLYILPNAFVGAVWSSPFYELSVNGAAVITYQIGYENPTVLQAFSPYGAALHSMALTVLYGLFTGLLLFLINLSGNRVVGFAVAASLHCFGYMFMSMRFNRIFPYLHSLLAAHNMTGLFGKNQVPGILESYLIFLFVGVILAVCILYRMEYVDFKITIGTKE